MKEEHKQEAGSPAYQGTKVESVCDATSMTTLAIDEQTRAHTVADISHCSPTTQQQAPVPGSIKSRQNPAQQQQSVERAPDTHTRKQGCDNGMRDKACCGGHVPSWRRRAGPRLWEVRAPEQPRGCSSRLQLGAVTMNNRGEILSSGVRLDPCAHAVVARYPCIRLAISTSEFDPFCSRKPARVGLQQAPHRTPSVARVP